jgi:hypothetical protein
MSTMMVNHAARSQGLRVLPLAMSGRNFALVVRW